MRIKDFIYTRQLPLALAVVLAVFLVDHFVAHDQGVTGVVGPVRKELFETIATIFGALFGFVITAFSIVVSLGESKLIARLKETGDYTRVTRAFINTTYVVGIATVVAVLTIFLDAKDGNPSKGWEYAVLLTSVAGGFSVLGIIFVLEMLIDAQA